MGAILAITLVVTLGAASGYLLHHAINAQAYRNWRHRSQRRVQSIFPDEIKQGIQDLVLTYKDSPHADLFNHVAKEWVSTIDRQVPTKPETLVRRAYTRQMVESIHRFFAHYLRNGMSIPPILMCNSPVFDSFSQPVIAEDRSLIPSIVFNPLVLLTLPSFLSMHAVIVHPSCTSTTRTDMMHRFLRLSKMLVMPGIEDPPRCILQDITLFHRLHIDQEVTAGFAEDFGYSPESVTGERLQSAYQCILEFMALQEAALHFQRNIDNTRLIKMRCLPEPDVYDYDTMAGNDADSYAIGAMLSYRSILSQSVEPTTLKFAVHFYLSLLEYFWHIALLYNVPCDPAIRRGRIERLIHLFPDTPDSSRPAQFIQEVDKRTAPVFRVLPASMSNP